MASTFQATTPPPPSSLHTPTTPRFGFDDNYQPYSPRKSARVSQRSRAAQTPPPQSGRNLRTHSSPRSSRKASSTDISSTPSSPQTASKKQAPRMSPTIGGRRVSGALNFESALSAASALGLPEPKMERRSRAAVRNNGMLPTPAKTPKKEPTEVAPGITAIARNLFPVRPETVEEVMPSPKKKGRKRYTGFTLDSFEAEEEDQPIQIYTDSNDRVPELDMSADNPFYGEGTAVLPEPTKRSSKRRKISVPGEVDQTAEEVERREDGLVYVFRGKKIFRKFADEDEAGSEAESEGEAELEEAVPERLRGRRLTRSSIKPRLLFPTPQQTKAKETRSHTTEDEEAETDIEESMKGVSTPMDQVEDVAATPKAPKFAPVSPPTTARATRSKKIDISSSPAAPTRDDQATTPMRKGRGGKVSPFDMWQRTKGSKGGATKKREGDLLLRGGEKKLRG